MRKTPFFILSLYLIFSFSGSLYGNSEKTISLGGASSWNSAQYRSGISEAPLIRQHPALVLTAGDNSTSVAAVVSAPDLALSFDEGKPGFFRDSAGHYRVTVSPALESADRHWARAGNGAALFSGTPAKINNEVLLIETDRRDALFSPGSRINDFSVEFWLYPFHLENGEEIFGWTAALPLPGVARYLPQYISCVAEKNRLSWSFANFFASPDGAQYLPITLSGTAPVVPKTWSHHIIRFDSQTGLIEYLADGVTQDITYATLSGREAGEVYTPLSGQDGSFSLGGSFTGLMDEFKIFGTNSHQPSLRKFPRSGRMETGAIDLGDENSGIYQIDARGGRTSLRTTRSSLEFRENGRFRFADDSEMQFFIRASENPYRWDNSPWLVFTPGMSLPGGLHGRYVQLAVDFYPSSDGECSPYLEEIRINYAPGEAPLPPSSLTAVAQDGSVQLRWKSSPDMETDGYLVYYGTKQGDYFGKDAILGVSPIDAGKHNGLFIDGLKNGVLYYFSVAAYKRGDSGAPHIGEFSREVTARPLQGLKF